MFTRISKIFVCLLLLPLCTIAQPRFIPLNGTGTAPVERLVVEDGKLLAIRSTSVDQSTDAGKTWHRVLTSDQQLTQITPAGNGDFYGLTVPTYKVVHWDASSQAWSTLDSTPSGIYYIFSATPNKLTVGYVYIYETTDNGKTWTGDQTYYIGRYNVGQDGVHYRYSADGWSRSTDQGENWTRVDVQASMITSGAHNDMYAFGSNDLRRTTNNGTTWSIGTLPFVSDGARLVAGSDGSIYYFLPSHNEFFQSSDHGATWHRMLSGQIVYSLTASKEGKVFAYVGNTLYSLEGREMIPQSSTLSPTVILDIEEDAVGNLYVSSSQSSTGAYFLTRSSDGGQTWIPFRTNAIGLRQLAFHGDRLVSLGLVVIDSQYHNSIIVSDDQANWRSTHSSRDTTFYSLLSINGSLLCGTYPSGVLRSTNNGESWHESNHGITNGYIFDLEKDQLGRVLSSTYNGIFVSVDNGASWSRRDLRVPNPSIASVAGDRWGRIYAGAPEGLYRLNPDGQWQRLYIGLLDWQPQDILIDSRDNIYVAGPQNNFYFSSNLGTTWQRIDVEPGMKPAITVSGMKEVKDGHIFLRTSNGVYRTEVVPAPASVSIRSSREREPSVGASSDGLHLINCMELGHLTLSLHDITGREALICAGSLNDVEQALARSVLQPGWYGYSISTKGERWSGGVVIRP
jgi:photosystem II stability/assembly factor-like uncharacterized protein